MNMVAFVIGQSIHDGFSPRIDCKLYATLRIISSLDYLIFVLDLLVTMCRGKSNWPTPEYCQNEHYGKLYARLCQSFSNWNNTLKPISAVGRSQGC